MVHLVHIGLVDNRGAATRILRRGPAHIDALGFETIVEDDETSWKEPSVRLNVT